MTQISRLGTAGYANETRQYNSIGQLTRITMPNMEDQEYVYSGTQNNGRITQSMNHLNNETITYGYDSLNRLISASSSLGWGLSFTYDGFGNLTDKTVTAGSAPSLHVTVDPTTNRLSGSNYSYDANGNLTGITGQFTATYNVENQIQSYTPSGGGTETYFYDEQNHRIWTNQANGKILMTFWGAHGERYHTANPTTGVYYFRNTYFGSQLIWNTQFNGDGSVASSKAIAMDRLGSVRGFGTQTTSFYPYGEEYTTTTQDREKFATYLRDNFSSLDYAWNRFYSSTLGRFMGPDLYVNSAGPGNPGSWNRYAYASEDPINRNDPRGLEDCLDCVDDGGGGGGDGGLGGGQGGCDPSLDSSCSPGLPCGFIYGTACGFGPPMPPPVSPPSEPSTPVPTCELAVYSRPLNYIGLKQFGPDLHGYLDYTGPKGALIVEGRHEGMLLGAAIEPTGLDDDPRPGHDTLDGEISGTEVRGAIAILARDVAQIKGARISYGAIDGPNSSSALRYMLESLDGLLYSFGPWYHIPASMIAFGYNTLLPGIEIPPAYNFPLPVRPIRIHLPHRGHIL